MHALGNEKSIQNHNGKLWGFFFLLLFKTSIIFSFPASHQMLAYLTRLLQGTVQKLEQDFNILKQSIMSLISY